MAALLVLALAVHDADAKKRQRVSRRAAAPIATGVNSPRYADIILNPATGEVYHSVDANERRYPASLTKMMTLYMLFEALDQKKTDLDARMDISELAASQPQTNLSLTAGDSISVETAIKALVVRSANDVAIVVGEALGGSVDNFARKMTAKARTLGMKSTVFKNPNGLPNGGQYTTAADMARLGIALKRDFPRYYKYFSTLQFSHDGVTYYTHNRVMLRYAGVDGIKTGFIGLSGFNLVTSVVRGGRPLVGVVMGGSSGRWRDDRMIELLDQSYETIASRGAARGKRYPANLPLPRGGGPKGVGLNLALTEGQEDIPPPVMPQQIPENREIEDGATVADVAAAAAVPVDPEEPRQQAASPFETAEQQMPEPAHETVAVVEKPTPVVAVMPPPVRTAAPVVVTTPEKPAPGRVKVIQLAAPEAASGAKPAVPIPFAVAAKAPETMNMERKPAPVATIPVAADDTAWGVQVGAFSTHELAMQAARNALQLAPKALGAAKLSVMGPAVSGVPVHRARLENISQLQARKACEALINNNTPCFIFKVTP
ncbi:MAG: serine hydrolase [Rickettsiales bacterium]